MGVDRKTDAFQARQDTGWLVCKQRAARFVWHNPEK
jgi:hypothetical protein